MKQKHTIKSLKQLLSDNNIKFNETSSKPELLFQLFDTGILIREDVFPPRELKPIDLKYEYLRSIRTNPKQVTYTDVETGETITYDSIYKARKATGHSGKFFLIRNRQDGKYMVTVE